MLFNFTYADDGGRAVKGMNCLRPLQHWHYGFESHLRHDVCMFILFVLSCMQVAALRRLMPRPESPTDYVKDQETEKR
jgi:hypothetical protein